MANRPLRILIVEDQFLIAKQVELILSMAGYVVVATATTLREAVERACDSRPDLALVDLSLGDGLTGTAVATQLIENHGVEVVFSTANMRRLPADFCGAMGVVEKPFTKADLVAAMRYVASRMQGLSASEQAPASFHLPASGLLAHDGVTAEVPFSRGH